MENNIYYSFILFGHIFIIIILCIIIAYHIYLYIDYKSLYMNNIMKYSKIISYKDNKECNYKMILKYINACDIYGNNATSDDDLFFDGENYTLCIDLCNISIIANIHKPSNNYIAILVSYWSFVMIRYIHLYYKNKLRKEGFKKRKLSNIDIKELPKV